MSTRFSIKRGDWGYDLTDTLGPTPLGTDIAVLRFIARSKNSQVPKVNAVATVVDQAAGTVKYTVAQLDFDRVGVYRQEWEITRTDGTTQTYPSEGHNEITIVDDLNP